VKQLLLLLSSYLCSIVDKSNRDNALSVMFVMIVSPPLYAFWLVLAALLHISMSPLLELGLFVGGVCWFGHYAKRFARVHHLEIIQQARTLKRAPLVALSCFALAFLLFALLAQVAGSIERPILP
jgi:hypothetical protein